MSANTQVETRSEPQKEKAPVPEKKTMKVRKSQWFSLAIFIVASAIIIAFLFDSFSRNF
ncbi:hypothetical protein [Vibrio sp. HN007]|uniref:hypothetical protein n=1 Tax=Vibrio iocasae TaxID=3098914 RepID=UPI0035D4D28C